MAGIQVNGPHYSGPMDLLLDLIKDSKINIYDIEISSITEDYLEAMQRLTIPPEEVSDFIRMAALLVLMKARSLVKDQEDTDDDLPTREEMIERLVRYQVYKEISNELAKTYERAGLIFRKLPEDGAAYRQEEEVIPEDPGALYFALQALIARKEEGEKEDFQAYRILSLEKYPVEKVAEEIRDKLRTGQHFDFFDLLPFAQYNRPRAIATFLSLLEMTRTQSIRLWQKEGEMAFQVEVLDRDRLEEVKEENHEGDENGREGNKGNH